MAFLKLQSTTESPGKLVKNADTGLPPPPEFSRSGWALESALAKGLLPPARGSDAGGGLTTFWQIALSENVIVRPELLCCLLLTLLLVLVVHRPSFHRWVSHGHDCVYKPQRPPFRECVYLPFLGHSCHLPCGITVCISDSLSSVLERGGGGE